MTSIIVPDGTRRKTALKRRLRYERGSIGITTNLADPNQGLLYLTASADPLNASSNANVTAAIPEPDTSILAGLALASLLLYRRHRP